MAQSITDATSTGDNGGKWKKNMFCNEPINCSQLVINLLIRNECQVGVIRVLMSAGFVWEIFLIQVVFKISWYDVRKPTPFLWLKTTWIEPHWMSIWQFGCSLFIQSPLDAVWFCTSKRDLVKESFVEAFSPTKLSWAFHGLLCKFL